ncbi:hypothetical protein GCM10023165_19220 [Variovorax defluvii]|uniref:HTH luxR-type domain-containing protein n=1 Tax=Variovorax defluvii TaxID=913761 RepID=A0ABP8HIK9_9BURK
MHSVSLARAKIQAPRFRAGLIERGELEQQLGQALATRRVVLLVAPAGYGKTAALSRQLQQLPPGRAIAWLTADEADDLQRFLSHLIEALEPLDPPWRLAPEAVFELATHRRLREAASALAGTLEATDAPDGGLIVLDDLHAVADGQVFDFLNHLLEDLPANWTVVMAARVEPPLTLGRWRARREMAEFDETILGFSRKEVQALCRHVTGEDDPDQAQRLLDRTQGWAAGLCLSLEAPERSAVTAPKSIWQSRRHLFDYLATEVLEHLPQELQAFLLRCSLLPELTVQRCQEVSGDPRAAEWLEDIERRRLFTSVLDSEELTLRLHDLFRDFLEERLRQLHPEEMPALLRLAARGETDMVRRTLMYLRAGAWDEAQQSVADATPGMLALDEGAQLIRIIEQFPAAIQEGSPFLAYARGLCAWPHYRYGAVRTAMTESAKGFDAMGRHHDAQRARAMQALAMFFSGDVDNARRLSQAVRAQAMDLETETLSELLDFWYEGHHGPIDGPGLHLARMVDLLLQGGSAELWSRCMPRVNAFLGRPGVVAQIRRLLPHARTAAGDGHWSLQTHANLMEAWLLLWQGSIPEVGAAFQRLEEDSRWQGQSTGSRLRLLTLKSYWQLLCDDREGVRATCKAIAAQAELLGRVSDLSIASLGIVARTSVVIEDWSTVHLHLPVLQAEFGHQYPYMQSLVRSVEASLALHAGRVDEALQILRELATRSAQIDMMFLDTFVRTRWALAELAAGSAANAWHALQPLIERVSASGGIGQILGAGVPCLTELSLAPWGDAAPVEGLALLRRWAERARQFKVDALVEPRALAANDAGLSDRELEVLALLADGQSNKLIARALDLSPHTVKRHVARILDRLDLASRMQAADWYRKRFGV